MKIATTLALLCTAVILSGCSTYKGGTSEEYNTSSGTVTEPGGVNALPPDNLPNTGPALPP